MDGAGLDNLALCDSDSPTAVPLLKDCVYTRCYCEENVWKLCDHMKNHSQAELQKCFAVFISNKNKQIPVWYQRASKREDRLVIWDYHVVMLYKDSGESWIYDLDTELPFPCQLDKYVAHAIRDDRGLKPEFRRSFRVVAGEEYLRTFASDRSHMVKEDGTWLAEPPVYPCIQTEDCQNNLQDFISMEQSEGVGRVLTSPQQLLTLSGPDV
ncbi:protein N-terminal glutamine amidohydrolase-like [Babylonia areolata]|uniref:protein N-terminal glutamine amidohydrolase-like n=1 Tax=Babylonia areolata TaxID=304850 RepID=UPI003FCF6D43